jgi:hypothetical protein
MRQSMQFLLPQHVSGTNMPTNMSTMHGHVNIKLAYNTFEHISHLFGARQVTS